MSLTSMITAAAGTHSSEPAIHPYAIGAIVLGILLVLLVVLLMFGKGRDHA